LFGNLTPEAFQYIVAQDPTVLTGLRIEALQLLPETIVQTLPQEVLDRIEQGGTPFVPTDSVTRTNGNSSLLLTVFKTSEANTVQTFHEVEKAIEEIQLAHPELIVNVAFEQASFIEESIGGVAREGVLGALFAMVVILVFLSGGHWASRPRRITGVVMTVLFVGLLVWLVGSQAANHGGDINQTLANLGENETIAFFLFCAAIVIGLVIVIAPFSLPSPSWRATLVIGVSIPLSVLAALIGMRWLSPAVHDLLEPLVESSSFFAFLIRLFPETLTLNIMTLSGLTVAIGRVVDDSIVVLENIFRQMQSGMDKREAVLTGTRDVSLAIFVATVVTVVVFLPLGLTGGLIGEFFLPFGLAVTYSLLASFIVAITVVPLLVFIFIRPEDETEETQTILERTYLPVLNWSLSSRSAKLMVVAVALLSAAFGFVLFGGRPAAFLPDFGDPQIGVNVSLPSGTTIIQTNQLAAQLETRIREIVPAERLGTVQSIVGGGGLSLESLLTGGGVSENVAAITIGLREANADELNLYTAEIRTAAYEIFGEENATVSAASLSEQGFGGFQVVLSGPQEDLLAINDRVIETLSAVPGLTNVSGNLAQAASAGTDAPVTYIRIDRQTAVSYTGELETQNTIGVTQQAITAIRGIPDLPATIKVSQGFETETQVQGFQGLFVAMIIAIAIMIVILIFTFGSPVYWLAIIFSIVVAPVGAAIALTITDRVLGISALIGLLMLLGIVVTNAVVLIDRVHTNDIKKKMPLKEALMEAGERRLRPIVMTALATIMALMPLALGLSKGAIIASELGTVVIGGLFSSTLLTLIVVPIAYSAFHPIHNRIMGVFRRSKAAQVEPQGSSAD
jgi:multidrug efflux pump subunit AcrB